MGTNDNPAEMWPIAYELHHTKKDLKGARKKYEELVSRFPNSTEAGWAKIQIDIIDKDEAHQAQVDWAKRQNQQYGKDGESPSLSEQSPAQSGAPYQTHKSPKPQMHSAYTCPSCKSSRTAKYLFYKKRNRKSGGGGCLGFIILLLIFGPGLLLVGGFITAVALASIWPVLVIVYVLALIVGIKMKSHQKKLWICEACGFKFEPKLNR